MKNFPEWYEERYGLKTFARKLHVESLPHIKMEEGGFIGNPIGTPFQHIINCNCKYIPVDPETGNDITDQELIDFFDDMFKNQEEGENE